jgi:Protein of unknown function (DUF1488)
MPLIPVAQAAVADCSLRSVCFTMKDGSKAIAVLVSNPALVNIEIAPTDRYFETFKLYRQSFERIASSKYENGFVEPDGTVCIRAMDVPDSERALTHAA